MLQNKEEIALILDKNEYDFYINHVVGIKAQKFLRELLGIDQEARIKSDLGKVEDEEVKEITKKILKTNLEGEDLV